MESTGRREVSGHPSLVMATASRAYRLAKKLGRQREATAKIREAFIKTYGDLRGECFYSIWLEWADEAWAESSTLCGMSCSDVRISQQRSKWDITRR